MDNAAARNNILEKIREALTHDSDSHQPEIIQGDIFKTTPESLLDKFSAEFAALDGSLEICAEKSDFLQKLTELREEQNWESIACQSGSFQGDFGLEAFPFAGENPYAVITGCECLVARTGTIVLSAAQDYGRILTVYTPVHIVVATVDQLVYDVGDGIGKIIQQYHATGLPSAIFFASGPSRTGDIEKALVRGVHGPVQVYLFLLQDDGDSTIADPSGHQSKTIKQ